MKSNLFTFLPQLQCPLGPSCYVFSHLWSLFFLVLSVCMIFYYVYSFPSTYSTLTPTIHFPTNISLSLVLFSSSLQRICEASSSYLLQATCGFCFCGIYHIFSGMPHKERFISVQFTAISLVVPDPTVCVQGVSSQYIFVLKLVG